MFLTCAFITLQFLEPDKNYSLTAFYYVLSLVNMHNFSPAIFSFTQLLVLQFNPGAIYLKGSKRPALVNILERERERERERGRSNHDAWRESVSIPCMHGSM